MIMIMIMFKLHLELALNESRQQVVCRKLLACSMLI